MNPRNTFDIQTIISPHTSPAGRKSEVPGRKRVLKKTHFNIFQGKTTKMYGKSFKLYLFIFKSGEIKKEVPLHSETSYLIV